MKRGDEVFVARVHKGAVVVDSARIMSPVRTGARWLEIDKYLGGLRYPAPEDVSRSRAEALQRLAKKLEESAAHSRQVATDFTVKAERCLIQAAQAKRMAEEGR